MLSVSPTENLFLSCSTPISSYLLQSVKGGPSPCFPLFRTVCQILGTLQSQVSSSTTSLATSFSVFLPPWPFHVAERQPSSTLLGETSGLFTVPNIMSLVSMLLSWILVKANSWDKWQFQASGSQYVSHAANRASLLFLLTKKQVEGCTDDSAVKCADCSCRITWF